MPFPQEGVGAYGLAEFLTLTPSRQSDGKIVLVGTGYRVRPTDVAAAAVLLVRVQHPQKDGFGLGLGVVMSQIVPSVQVSCEELRIGLHVVETRVGDVTFVPVVE